MEIIKLKAEDLIALDEPLCAFIQAKGIGGCSVSEIQDKFGDAGLIRTGMLVASHRLKCIGGGGKNPYILTIND